MADSKAREGKIEVGFTEVINNDSNFVHEYADDEAVDDEQTPEKVGDGELQVVPEVVVGTQAEEQAVEREENPTKDSGKKILLSIVSHCLPFWIC